MLLGLVAGAISALAIEAHAYWTPGCVTKHEYHAVEKGWSKHRVHNKFDAGGKLFTLNSSTMSRKYKRCSTEKYDVTVWYKLKDHVWRVTAKDVA